MMNIGDIIPAKFCEQVHLGQNTAMQIKRKVLNVQITHWFNKWMTSSSENHHWNVLFNLFLLFYFANNDRKWEIENYNSTTQVEVWPGDRNSNLGLIFLRNFESSP